MAVCESVWLKLNKSNEIQSDFRNIVKTIYIYNYGTETMKLLPYRAQSVTMSEYYVYTSRKMMFDFILLNIGTHYIRTAIKQNYNKKINNDIKQMRKNFKTRCELCQIQYHRQRTPNMTQIDKYDLMMNICDKVIQDHKCATISKLCTVADSTPFEKRGLLMYLMQQSDK